MEKMGKHFTAQFFIDNRQRLRTLFAGKAPIVLTANGQLQRNGPNAFKFRQDSSFWYLTGITDPDVILVIDKHKEYLILPEREDITAVFDGAIEAQAITETSGIETVYDQKNGWKQLCSRLKKVKHAATLSAAPAYDDLHTMYTNPARGRLLTRMIECNPSLEMLDLREHLMHMRMVKQPLELQAIQSAVDLTVSAFQSLKKRLGKFEYEYEIDADMQFQFARQGYETAYPNIVAADKNACQLHYHDNNQPVAKNALLLLDIGAEFNMYASDITRVFATGTVTKRQQSIYDAVMDVHQHTLELLKPGVSVRDNERHIEAYMGEKLRELGLIKTIERESVRHYFPHATSHYLGIDVHDVGDYTAPLSENMVLTVEPGIYIPEEGIGIRIEDDVAITANGCEVMSKRLSHGLS